MNSYAFTQSLYTAPRDRSHPRMAKSEPYNLTVGNDSKYYTLVDEREYNRYHVLSDEQIEEELQRSREMKRNILAVSGSSYGKANQKTGIKVTAPMFGTSSRSKKIASKQWEKDLQLATQGKSTIHIKDNSREKAILTQLIANTEDQPEVESETNEDEFFFDKKAVTKTEGKISKVFNVIKQKYEQNLHVVEKLHEEKMTLEEYAKSLEEELLRTTGKLPENSLRLSLLENTEDRLISPQHDEHALYEDDTSDRERDSTIRMGRSKLSAREAALQIDRPRSAGPTLTRSNFPQTRSLSASRSQESFSRASSRTPRRKARRSLSASGNSAVFVNGRSVDGFTSTFHISKHLQADIDNYVQRRRLSEERDRLKRLEQEQFELQEKQRRLLAAQKGKDFSEMMMRQQLAKEQQTAKLKELQDKERQKEIEDLKQKKLMHKKNMQSMAHAIHGTLSWKELQEQEEARRRDRIERRKQELIMLSNSGANLALLGNQNTNSSQSVTSSGSVSRRRQRQENQALIEEEEEKKRRNFKAQDPEVVTQRLSKQQRIWESRLQREKQKLQQQFDERQEKLRKSSSGNLFQTAMELRAEQQKQKREQRLQEQRERERREKEEREQKERQRMQSLINSKLTESCEKKTKSAELREAKVRAEMQLAEAEERRRQRLLERKKLSLKEASAMLSLAMKEREEELAAKGARRVELSVSEQEARQRAMQAKKDYNEKLKENAQRIRAALANRPSLLQRHDQSIAEREASANALKKLATVVIDTNKDKHGDDVFDDDFFNPKEKAVVSSMLKSGALYEDNK